MAVPERLLPHGGTRSARRRGEPVDRLPLRRPRAAGQPGRDRESRPWSPTWPRSTAASCYPEGQADNNGADIFRAGVGYAHNATYWRVDWNTLANADVPIAEWTFSTESATPAAGETWPANAGRAARPGIQYALVVSAQHARLLDAATGAPVAGGELHTEVDLAAHSFVVRIPTTVLPVSGSWQVRLAAGLSNAAGTEFETVPPQDGGLPGGTNVYNVTFRSYQQEERAGVPDRSSCPSPACRRC